MTPEGDGDVPGVALRILAVAANLMIYRLDDGNAYEYCAPGVLRCLCASAPREGDALQQGIAPARFWLAVRWVDIAILYDSQVVTPGTHAAVAVCRRDRAQEKVNPLPEWAQRVLP